MLEFSLTVFRYVCKEPKIDDATQEPENCKDRLAWGGSAIYICFTILNAAIVVCKYIFFINIIIQLYTIMCNL